LIRDYVNQFIRKPRDVETGLANLIEYDAVRKIYNSGEMRLSREEVSFRSPRRVRHGGRQRWWRSTPLKITSDFAGNGGSGGGGDGCAAADNIGVVFQACSAGMAPALDNRA
jgi:hypothetical protein